MATDNTKPSPIKGLLLIFLFACASFYIASFKVVKDLSLSPLIIGILLGMIYANTFKLKLPDSWLPGIKICTKQILRTGIVLYGFRLTISDVIAVGLPAIVVDVIIVTCTLLLGAFLGKCLKMDAETAIMTSTGSSICGAAAVLGAEGVVKCSAHKTAIAVSTVVIFGTIAMFLYPIMYRTGLLNGLSDTAIAIYTGGTLHEVAHVAGAGNAMDPTDTLGIAATATITKMIRVMLLAPVLIVLAVILNHIRQARNEQNGQKAHITIPYFAFGFILVIGLNSILQSLTGAATVKEIPLNGVIEYLDTFLLTMAMTALGVDTSIDKFKQAGAKPFILAFLLFIWLVGGGYFVTDFVVNIFA